MDSNVNKKIENENLKQFGAVLAMEHMLTRYAEKYNVSMNEALYRFTSSKVYEDLFDYDGTELWKEGSLYLLKFYEDCVK